MTETISRPANGKEPAAKLLARYRSLERQSADVWGRPYRPGPIPPHLDKWWCDFLERKLEESKERKAQQDKEERAEKLLGRIDWFYKVPRWLAAWPGLNWNDRALWAYVHHHAGDGWRALKQETMMSRLGLSKPTVERSTRRLEAAHLLESRQVGKRRANEYRVFTPAAEARAELLERIFGPEGDKSV